MSKLVSRSAGLADHPSGFCPGCTHATLTKIIMECIEEMGLLGQTITVLPIGCASLNAGFIETDLVMSAHGRAPAVATGVKRCQPDKLVFTYQGDGDLASIGLTEIMMAANRGEHFCTFFVNNGIYGMTGGQMAPTTLIGMRATTAPFGRKAEEHGYPMHVCELMNDLKAPHYLERVSCNTPQNVIKTRNAIRKAFQYQLDGKGFSLVEVMTACPTNWGLSALEALDYLQDKMIAEFPLGVIRDLG